MKYGFLYTQTSLVKGLHCTATIITHTPTCPTNNAHAYDFLFFGYFPSPKIRGAGWGGGAQQQQQKSAAGAAAAAAAAARTRGNEINTAMRSNALLTCRLAVF